MRKHCRTVRSVRLFSWVCLLTGLGMLIGASAQSQSAHINRIVIDASINPAVGDFIHENIDQSAQELSLIHI